MTYKIYKIKDYNRPFYIEDFKSSDYLIIPFSGYGQDFEWFKTLNKYEEKYNFSKLWIRDLSNAYWHGKIPGIDEGVISIGKFIKNKIKESKAKKIMMLGLSMGGYGSILFGCLLDVDLVLSFSGQTFISDHRRKKYKLYEKWKDIKIDESNVDLSLLFDKYNKNNKCEYKLFYGNKNISDTNYAKYLDKKRGVELIPIKTDKHNSVKLSIKEGYVDKYFKEFLTL